MQYLTNEIYWASKPDAYQPLRDLPGGGPDRRSLATALEEQGLVIDVPIDVWGWDAGGTMAYRQSLGFKTVPSSLQTMPGTVKVSVDAADYPPYHPSMPKPPAVTSPVGAESPVPGVYTWTPAAFDAHGNPLFLEGQSTVAPDGNTVTFHMYRTAPFGTPSWLFETAAAKAKRLKEEGTAL